MIWRTYYSAFWKLMTSKYGYELGVNLYAAPYDWRLGFEGMDQVRREHQQQHHSVAAPAAGVAEMKGPLCRLGMAAA